MRSTTVVASASTNETLESVKRRLTLLHVEATVLAVTSRELRKILKGFGCVEVRQRGSHLVVRCGQCQTVIPVHPGEDLGPGLLQAIERQLTPCLGKGWLQR